MAHPHRAGERRSRRRSSSYAYAGSILDVMRRCLSRRMASASRPREHAVHSPEAADAGAMHDGGAVEQSPCIGLSSGRLCSWTVAWIAPRSCRWPAHRRLPPTASVGPTRRTTFNSGERGPGRRPTGSASFDAREVRSKKLPTMCRQSIFLRLPSSSSTSNAAFVLRSEPCGPMFS